MGEIFRGRREDRRLLTGQGLYAADRHLPGEAIGLFLRADRAHAEILSIDIAQARAMPGVLCILTGADTKAAGFTSPAPLANYPGRGGEMIKNPRRQVLAEDRVRYVGQEVALVVAETQAQAQAALEVIVVDYRDLPAVIDLDAALSDKATLLYPELGTNLAFDFDYGDETQAHEALAKAAHVTCVELDLPRLIGHPMEPKSAIIHYDPQADLYHVYSPTQGMTLIRDSLASCTGIAPEKIKVHAQDVGGGFGVRTEGYPEYCAMMLASQRLKRPVKWPGTRAETFVSDHHARAGKLFGELALDEEGNFMAIRVKWVVHGGGYLSQAGPLINTMPPRTHVAGLYRIPAIYGRHQVVLTNTTPTTAYRGAGRPNVSYLLERLVDQAAIETGRDRIALRRQNLIAKEAFPYATPIGNVYDSGDPKGMLDMALRESRWEQFEQRRADAAKRGKLRGIALSMFVEPSGGGRSAGEQAVIKFGDSGNPILYSTSGPSGQGHETTYPEIVAKVFGTDPMSITNRSSDPNGPALTGDGTIGSRSTMLQGSSLFTAAQEAVRKGRDLAAKQIEVSADDLEFSDGRYAVRGTDLSVALYDLARDNPGALDSMGETKIHLTFPGGAHVAEVEVDPDTGEVALVDYVAVDDCGVAINHKLIEGQVHGGIVQGLGQVLCEQCLYDPESGQLLTGSFMDYAMPRAGDFVKFRLFDHSSPSPNNPLGVKGVGEAGTTGAVPTMVNAVLDALRQRGVEKLDIPFTPPRVWAALTRT